MVKLALVFDQTVSAYPYNKSALKKFDVFARKGRTGWAYKCSIEAATESHAKELVLQEHEDLKKHQLAVYPKR